MKKADRVIYPEIECWPAIGVDPEAEESKRTSFQSTFQSKSIDVLEVIGGETHILGFDDKSDFLRHFTDSSNSLDGSGKEVEVPLRVFFIERLDLSSGWPNDDTDIAAWFTETCGVSPLFFQLFHPSAVRFRNDGGTSFPTRDSAGEVASLDGFYQISSGLRIPPSYLWFKHAGLQNHHITSTYILYKCPQEAKHKIISLLQEKSTSLLRPLSIDALILAERLNAWGSALHAEHEKLRPYITNIRKPELFAASDNEAVHNLHYLSEHFHVVRTALADLEECIDYLSSICREYPTVAKAGAGAREGKNYGPVSDSLAYLRARTKTLARWAGTYIAHTEIAMNLLFNLFTSAIAVSTQQDSASMITMAAVTMFFLPGTFVSAVFSMVFFNTNSSNSGLVVDKQLWLFFVITVPLTAAVFAGWELWRRRRLGAQRAAKARKGDRGHILPEEEHDVKEDEGEDDVLPFGGEFDGGVLRRSPSVASRDSKAKSREAFALSVLAR